MFTLTLDPTSFRTLALALADASTTPLWYAGLSARPDFRALSARLEA